MRGIRTQAVAHALKNTLVWMKSDGKEKAQGVAVVDLLRPAGLFYFARLVAKITRFYSHSMVPVGLGVISYNTRFTPFTSLKILSVIFASKS